MGQVLIRNLDDDVIARLKLKAAGLNLSLEQFLRDVLTEKARADRVEKLQKIRALRESIEPFDVDVVQVVRDGRDVRDARIALSDDND